MKRAIRRSLGDFSRHPWLHLVSVSTISIALLLVGTFFLVHRNLNALAEKSKGQSSGTIFLKEQLPEAEIAKLREQILSLAGIKSISFKNKHQVMDELQSLIHSRSTARIPSTDLLPDVFEIELQRDSQPARVSQVKSLIAAMPGVAEVDFSEGWIQQFQKAQHFFRIIGVVLALAVIMGCGFIIANFMGMRNQARRAEIEITRLHGAHTFFILAPFLWEGFMEGLIGASASILFLFVGKTLFGTFLSEHWLSLLGMREVLFLSFTEVTAVVVIGISMAFFGSVTAFLRMRESTGR